MQRRLLAVRRWPVLILFLLVWFPLLLIICRADFWYGFANMNQLWVKLFKGMLFEPFDIRNTGALDQSTMQKGFFILTLFSTVFVPYIWGGAKFLGENYSKWKWLLLLPYILIAYFLFLWELTLLSYLVQYMISFGFTLARVLGVLYLCAMGYMWYMIIRQGISRLYGLVLDSKLWYKMGACILCLAILVFLY